jgi:ArsR family transcriptional regulator
VAQPTISHHLKVLREAGWVTTERHGSWIWYSLCPDAAARFRELAGEITPGAARPAAMLRKADGPAIGPVDAPTGCRPPHAGSPPQEVQ